jgi:hypothetical protein
LYEEVKRDSYKHYENVVNKIPAKDVKRRLPLLKVPQSTQALLVETKDTTNRLAINFKTSFYRINCTAKLKYNMPTPLAPFIAKL